MFLEGHVLEILNSARFPASIIHYTWIADDVNAFGEYANEDFIIFKF